MYEKSSVEGSIVEELYSSLNPATDATAKLVRQLKIDIARLSTEKREAIAKASEMQQTAVASQNLELQKQAQAKLFTLFGKDHPVAVLAQLETCRMSLLPILSQAECAKLKSDCERMFGKDSLPFYDACFVNGQRLAYHYDEGSIDVFLECQQAYERLGIENPGRRLQLQLRLANAYIQFEELSKAYTCLRNAKQIEATEDIPESQLLQLCWVQSDYSIATFEPKSIHSWVSRGEKLLDGNPELQEMSPVAAIRVLRNGYFLSKMRDALPFRAINLFNRVIKLTAKLPKEFSLEEEAQLCILCTRANLLTGQRAAMQSSLKDGMPHLKAKKSVYYAMATMQEMEHLMREGKYEQVLEVSGAVENSIRTDPLFGTKESDFYLCRAVAKLKLNQVDSAISNIQQAHVLAVEECSYRSTKLGMNGLMRFSMELDRCRNIANGIALHANSGKSADIAFENSLRSKGFLSRLLRKFPRKGPNSTKTVSVEVGNYLSANKALRTALIDGIVDSPSIESLELEKEHAYKTMLSTLSDNIGSKSQNVLRDFRAKLPASVAVVEFDQHLNLDTGGSRYVAIIAKKNGLGEFSTSIIDLGSVNLVNHLISKFNKQIQIRLDQRQLAMRGIKGEKRKGNTNSTANSKLFNQVWKEIGNKIGDCKTVVICPSSKLARVPWTSLVDPTSEAPLIKRYQIVVNDYANEVLMLLRNKPRRPDSCLCLGGVEFGKVENGIFNLDLPFLPNSLREVNSTHETFQKIGKRAAILSGKRATKTNLLELISDYSSLNIATHSVWCQRHPDPAKEYYSQVLRRNPLVSRQIVLANEDGEKTVSLGSSRIVTADEIADLDLSHLDLVVLSMCQSGAGEHSTSDGEFSMDKAFRMAGANSVLSNRYSIDDSVTAEFIARFNKYWVVEKMSKGEAFQKCLRDMIDAKVPAHLWAGWQLSGDWR
ncbi:MAG: CHAT domain-containing protein [Mariniblastus sp.]